uniref:Metaxin glutathione S-transferase domain-containing protein n=1 Tax=Trypanosoma congolense (strain IL3000) TaxID=1068625 RepID=G0USQ6_TRYCI|nr:conserved hypothetical protein [Trypanosoma congolense IL3000]
MEFDHALKVVCAATVGTALFVSACIRLFSTARRQRQVAVFCNAVCQDGDYVSLFIHPRWGLSPSISPSCTAVETFLRLAKIPYKAYVSCEDSLASSPLLPCIVYRGQCVAGTVSIIQHLMGVFQIEMDDELNGVQHAIGIALRSMLVCGSRFALRHTLSHQALIHTVPHAMSSLDASLTSVMHFFSWLKVDILSVGKLRRLNLLEDQYENSYMRDLEAVEALIGNKPYLFGSEPTSYDCVVYAMLLPIMRLREAIFVNEPFAFAAQSSVLRGYVQRMSGAAFNDLEQLCCNKS